MPTKVKEPGGHCCTAQGFVHGCYATVLRDLHDGRGQQMRGAPAIVFKGLSSPRWNTRISWYRKTGKCAGDSVKV